MKLRLPRRVLMWGGAVLGVLALWLVAPSLLKRLAFFRVRQVEVVGVKNLDPDAVLAALRLAPKASVFDDTRLLADRVRGMAGVADARVTRALPASLKVIVREVEPVALVPGAGGLVAVDAGGGACRSIRRAPRLVAGDSISRSRRWPTAESCRCWAGSRRSTRCCFKTSMPPGASAVATYFWN